MDNSQDGRNIGIGRYDDLITFFKAAALQGKDQCIEAIGYANYMLFFMEGPVFLLK